ncbi:hypothetical protein P3S67_008006 [Capsicum chacoense]
MVENEIKSGQIISQASLKETTQAIQSGSRSFGENKREEDITTIVPGPRQNWRCARQPYAQNPLYFISSPHLFQKLRQKDLITPLLGYTPDLHSRNFDPNVRCVYHSDVQGHSTEDCRALKREIERMIQDKLIMVQDVDSGEGSSHADVRTGEDIKLNN